MSLRSCVRPRPDRPLGHNRTHIPGLATKRQEIRPINHPGVRRRVLHMLDRHRVHRDLRDPVKGVAFKQTHCARGCHPDRRGWYLPCRSDQLTPFTVRNALPTTLRPFRKCPGPRGVTTSQRNAADTSVGRRRCCPKSSTRRKENSLLKPGFGIMFIRPFDEAVVDVIPGHQGSCNWSG